MTELMIRLPKDLQREVWSFLGMDSLGKTPSGLAVTQFYDDLEKYYTGYRHLKGDMLYRKDIYLPLAYEKVIMLERHFYEQRDIYDNYFGNWTTFRNYIIFDCLFKEQRKFDKSISIKLNAKLIGMWYKGVYCKKCDYKLSAKEFLVLDHHENMCNDCYGIHYQMMKDEDDTEKQCVDCENILSVAEFKSVQTKYYDYWLCEICEEARNSDDESIYLDNDDE